MEPIFQQDFQVQDMCVDRYGRLKPSTLLYFAQEIAGLLGETTAETKVTLTKLRDSILNEED